MIKALFIAVLATGAFGSVILPPSEESDDDVENHHDHRQVNLGPPCPLEWNSAPCECSGNSQAPNIDCSLADQSDQLVQVFSSLPNGVPFVTFSIHEAKLTSLPSNPFLQSNFTTFVISNTNVTSMPNDFFTSSKNVVRSITISNTMITDFPFRALRGLPKLEILILENNKITSVPSEAFGEEGLPALHDLNLGGNQIKTIGSFAFSNIPFLYKLDISENNLTRIDKQAFSMRNHKESVVLSLAKNLITEFDKDAFQDLSFSSIHLEFNRLTTLDRGMFEPVLHYLEQTDSSIYLMGNPFVCNKSMQWLVDKSLPIKQHLRDFVCPNGKTLETLTSSDLLEHKRP